MQIDIQIRTTELRASLSHMSQAELARQTGLSKTTVSNLESGRLQRIELATIAKLCHALKCTPDDLFAIEFNSDEQLVLQAQKDAILALAGTIKSGKQLLPNELDQKMANLTNKQVLSKTKSKSPTRLKKEESDDFR